MKLIIWTYIAILLLLSYQQVYSSENRLRALGEIKFAIPDLNSQVNLYQIAGNAAWLKKNDSTNWMYYTVNSSNNWGTLKREWDAKSNRFHYFSFSGQKHLDEDKTFFGDIRYNWDYRKNVDYAIEKRPYSLDPFVLADYTTGSILYRGPEIFVAFNHELTNSFFWGVSLNYYINRGLKNEPSEAEIISREIRASIDLIYNANRNTSFGLSISPYQTQDITKLVTQKDGLEPTTRRFRGEFEFREKTGTSDRTADYDGYEIKPQFYFKNSWFDHVSFLSYYYQWHRIYDGSSTRHYDGYFQAQHLSFKTVNRLVVDNQTQTNIIFVYNYSYYDDWAKEPNKNLLISRVFCNDHYLIFGGSTKFSNTPLLYGCELHWNYSMPHQIDYLAQKDREGAILNWEFRNGIEFQASQKLRIRAGYVYKNYSEDKVWNYFQNYNGYSLTFGSGWEFKNFEIDIYGTVGLNEGKSKDRKSLNFLVQLKQYL